MRIVEILIWGMGLVWAIAQGFNIRQKAKREQATEHTFELHALLAAASVIIVPILSMSPLHLLWMLPASFVLGLASVIPPLNLLWFPASLYGQVWYVGTRNPGRALYLAGDYEKAIEAYEETIMLKPKSAEAHFNLGVAYGKVGDKEKAIQSFKNTIQLSPDSAEAHCNLGFNYKDLGNLSDAAISFREAIRIRPGYARAIWNLGMVHVEMGDLDDALKQYHALQAIDQKNADELHAAIVAAGKNV